MWQTKEHFHIFLLYLLVSVLVVALSNILENTALFGDIILHLPDISHRILKAQQSLNSTIHWSLNFANRTRHLLDKSTITMIHLVEQELNITERDPNYFNRYRSAVHADEREDDSKTTTAKKKKKKQFAKRDKRKKGPQIAKIELWATSYPRREIPPTGSWIASLRSELLES